MGCYSTKRKPDRCRTHVERCSIIVGASRISRLRIWSNARVELQTNLQSREAITEHLKTALEGLYSTDAVASEIDGSREAALELLAAFAARGYGKRNFVDARTSRLSAYLRHGVLSVTEVAAHVKRHAAGRERDEFLKQLTWREFFNLVLEQEGAGTLQNLEPPKYAVRWQAELPDDIRNGETGLPCVDAWVTRLVTENYLHNHERLWFAAYATHFRRVTGKPAGISSGNICWTAISPATRCRGNGSRRLFPINRIS